MCNFQFRRVLSSSSSPLLCGRGSSNSVARAMLERFKVAETGVSGRSSRLCRALLLLQPFPPGTQPTGGPIKLPPLYIDHVDCFVIFAGPVVAVSTFPHDRKRRESHVYVTNQTPPLRAAQIQICSVSVYTTLQKCSQLMHANPAVKFLKIEESGAPNWGYQTQAPIAV